MNDTTNGHTRVVVTGMGAITPLGNDVEQTWQGLIAGCSGVRPITAFDVSAMGTQIAATVQGFDAGKYMDPKEARRLSPFIQFGIAASVQAVNQSGIDFAAGGRHPLRRGAGQRAGRHRAWWRSSAMIYEARGQRAVNPTDDPRAS